MKLQDIKVYRMTHLDNLPHIIKWGITHKNSSRANPCYVNIGDLSLISTRNSREVFIDNGDLINFGYPSIILGNFIPFYFGIKMPMLYVIQNGGNFVEKATQPENIIYIACSLSSIIASFNQYYFTDGHATDHLTSFYDSSKIADLPNIIDWKSVKEPFWGGEDNLNIKRKKQAEFLIQEDIPANHIVGFVCYNEVAKQKLLNLGIPLVRIKVLPNAYY